MKSFIPHFEDNFYQKLLTPAGNNPVRDRASGFYKMFDELEKLNKRFFLILETGCMRPDHGEMAFGDDGCSTYLFNQFINFHDGFLRSVDISETNCSYSRKVVTKGSVVNKDSVEYLYLMPDAIKYDLIYLDSFDLERGKEHLSQLHHLKELCAVLKNTSKGTLVVVDDNDVFDGNGKGNYVKDFMKDIKAEILHDGYQIIFKL